MSNKTLPAPFIPEKIDNFDKKYCESIEETQLRYEEIMLCTNFNTAFSDFYFNKNEIKRNNDINNLIFHLSINFFNKIEKMAKKVKDDSDENDNKESEEKTENSNKCENN